MSEIFPVSLTHQVRRVYNEEYRVGRIVNCTVRSIMGELKVVLDMETGVPECSPAFCFHLDSPSLQNVFTFASVNVLHLLKGTNVLVSVPYEDNLKFSVATDAFKPVVPIEGVNSFYGSLFQGCEYEDNELFLVSS
jgi:hypothetical protein